MSDQSFLSVALFLCNHYISSFILNHMLITEKSQIKIYSFIKLIFTPELPFYWKNLKILHMSEKVQDEWEVTLYIIHLFKHYVEWLDSVIMFFSYIPSDFIQLAYINGYSVSFRDCVFLLLTVMFFLSTRCKMWSKTIVYHCMHHHLLLTTPHSKSVLFFIFIFF